MSRNRSTNPPPTHNLLIESYSLDEILALFDMTSYTITVDDLKRAKKKVLMLHPDKSRLLPEYFLFYKKAFDIVVQFYENQHRQNQVIDENTTNYLPHDETGHNKATHKKINQTIGKMTTEVFQDRFNQLFEENQMADRPDPRRNEWFGQEEAVYSVPSGQSVSAKNMGQLFDTFKQSGAGMVQYRGVQEMVSSAGSGVSALYGNGGEEDADEYVTSDPFSKLKYDDLRKVHKDQTVFAVSEADFAKVQTYSSVDQFNRARNQHSYDPLEKEKAQHILQEQERMTKERIMRKEYEAKLRTQEYAAKNKTILASFLHLGN